MADRKSTTTRSTRPQRGKKSVQPEKKQSSWFSTDFFRFGESYSSLVLGIIVMIAVAALLVSFARTGARPQENQDTSSTSTQAVQPSNKVTPGGSYTVEEGDDLWKIAEEAYQDGYMWEKIAAANNIADPSQLSVGTKLQIPEAEIQLVLTHSPTVTPTAAEVSEPTVTTPAQNIPTPTISGIQNTTGPPAKMTPGMSYTVVTGDTLWDIAERTYGSGYRWVDIAKANNLQNPDLIYPGHTFQLPK